MLLSLHPRAEACGKVILLGEHAVVYGKPALAAALPQALVLTAEPLARASDPMTLKIPAWDLDLILTAESDHPVTRAALQTLGYCDGPLRGWAIAGNAGLPAGAGLGSSAALCVALARLALGPDAEVTEVIAASMVGERVFHGAPSGIDSEVAARGGVLRFVRGQPPQTVVAARALPLLIVDSGKARRTAALVAAVAARHERIPQVIRPILDALSECVLNATEALTAGHLVGLGEVMTIAHGLLCSLGVSAPILDQMCSTALARGALGAKLTGAGGGGCIVAIPGPDSARTDLTTAFTQQGLQPLSIDLQPQPC